MLTMWDSSEVEVWSSTRSETISVGLFVGEDSVADWGEGVCVCGDFNAVRSIEERRSARNGPYSSDHIPFNQFIDDSVLFDLPLSG
ncbi:endonuclease/exonuclease/phosphatase family protein, partial [Trifolium medium]|nr:endonuclease/exonuclease/phosphatase family protein [Trifolium medium]